MEKTDLEYTWAELTSISETIGPSPAEGEEEEEEVEEVEKHYKNSEYKMPSTLVTG